MSYEQILPCILPEYRAESRIQPLPSRRNADTSVYETLTPRFVFAHNVVEANAKQLHRQLRPRLDPAKSVGRLFAIWDAVQILAVRFSGLNTVILVSSGLTRVTCSCCYRSQYRQRRWIALRERVFGVFQAYSERRQCDTRRSFKFCKSSGKCNFRCTECRSCLAERWLLSTSGRVVPSRCVRSASNKSS